MNSVYKGLSCAFGETSSDSGRYGGEYTHALLEAAKQCIVMEKSKTNNEEKNPIYSYPFVHSLARQTVIVKTQETQRPVFEGPKTWQPPFCVIL